MCRTEATPGPASLVQHETQARGGCIQKSSGDGARGVAEIEKSSRPQCGPSDFEEPPASIQHPGDDEHEERVGERVKQGGVDGRGQRREHPHIERLA